MLAITGIYGLVSYSVAQRTHEIGIRVAIGAGPAQVVKLVLGRTFKLLAAGSMIGSDHGPGEPRFMSSVIFGVGTSADLLAFAAVLLTIVRAGSDLHLGAYAPRSAH